MKVLVEVNSTSKGHKLLFLYFRPSKRKHGMESAGLSDFARHALKEMCKQDWVQEKFLKDPEGVQSSDLLLDNMLSNKQVGKVYSSNI